MFSSGAHITVDDDSAALAKWIGELPKPVAVFAANDVRARQVAQTCRRLAFEIPKDVAIIGVDDDPIFSEGQFPGVSSIKLDCEACGFAAAEMLDDLMAGRKMRTRLFRYGPVALTERESTDFSLVSQPFVVRKIRGEIRRNIRVPMTIDQLVKSAHLPRRSSEIAFRKATGHSILEELHEARITLVEQLLAETNIPIPVIADRSGFGHVSTLRRVFFSRHGMTMQDWRIRKVRG